MTRDVMGGIENRELCQVFGSFATGVTVVTTRTSDGIPHGATVTAFAAVSLDPPLAQVTLTRASRAAGYLEGAPFAVNILSLEQIDAARHFAGSVADTEPKWTLDGDVPELAGNAATLVCRPWNIYDGGDHIIVVGEVIAMDITEREPLVSFGGAFHTMGRRVEGDRCDANDSGWFAGSESFTPFPAPKSL
ncbi:flavin reductase family protein [Arthrobacter sp. UKPF54-2]|uniref:flavin reductase family protein n=1 Tax=Arthrobacter sp. UKPF54-2 TaxID=2600159 RepID=UPI0011B121D0|nr:flavin reductase family protein [Arthrobacter sp. UKPF54-2]QDY89801.1 flavin reductase family protein [Arthrobacter sp. UKPF54-2]